MKKFFEKYCYIGCLLPLIIGGLFPIVMMFVGLWKLCNGHIGYFIINVLAIPFGILGFANIARGFFRVMEDDETNLCIDKLWKYILYFIANIVGYLAIALAIVQFVKFQ
jgi:hypothetical protein